MRQKLRDREYRDVDGGRAGIELGDVEQRAEQLVHRGERFFDAADNLTALGGAQLALQLRDEEAQSMERLTQIVTGRSNEARLGLIGGFELAGALFDLAFQTGIGFLQPGGHGIELIAERLKFVAGIDRNALPEIAAANTHGAIAQGANRPDHAAGEQQSGENSEHERYQNYDPGTQSGIVQRGISLIDWQLGKHEPSRRGHLVVVTNFRWLHLSIGAQNTPAGDVNALQGSIGQAAELCRACRLHLRKAGHVGLPQYQADIRMRD